MFVDSSFPGPHPRILSKFCRSHFCVYFTEFSILIPGLNSDECLVSMSHACRMRGKAKREESRLDGARRGEARRGKGMRGESI